MPDWKNVGKKTGKAWATGGASLAYDKIKQNRESKQAADENQAKVAEEAAAVTAGDGAKALPIEPQMQTESMDANRLEPSTPAAIPEPDADDDEDSAGAEASILPTADADVAALARKLNKRVVKALEENLTPGETIMVVIRGAKGQAIVGCPTRAFVVKPGWLAGAAFGAEVTSWSYRNLVGVQLHKGMMSGSVVLQAPGQSGKRTSYWGEGDDDPFKAPNAIPVAGEWNEVKAAVAKLRQLMDASHNPEATSPPPAASPSAVSVADELKKLVELKDSGVLSEEEFTAAKRRLLEE